MDSIRDRSANTWRTILSLSRRYLDIAYRFVFSLVHSRFVSTSLQDDPPMEGPWRVVLGFTQSAKIRFTSTKSYQNRQSKQKACWSSSEQTNIYSWNPLTSAFELRKWRSEIKKPQEASIETSCEKKFEEVGANLVLSCCEERRRAAPKKPFVPCGGQGIVWAANNRNERNSLWNSEPESFAVWHWPMPRRSSSNRILIEFWLRARIER